VNLTSVFHWARKSGGSQNGENGEGMMKVSAYDITHGGRIGVYTL
jgi:hypothetical protein